MRAGIALVAAAFVLFFGAQSYASTTFPDLPGMGAVAKTTHSQEPQTSRSVSAPSTSTESSQASNVGAAAKSSVSSDTIAPILKMPGSGAVPVIKDFRTAQRARTAMPDVLFVLAGIGTATSLGMLWAVRRRFDRA